MCEEATVSDSLQNKFSKNDRYGKTIEIGSICNRALNELPEKNKSFLGEGKIIEKESADGTTSNELDIEDRGKADFLDHGGSESTISEVCGQILDRVIYKNKNNLFNYHSETEVPEKPVCDLVSKKFSEECDGENIDFQRNETSEKAFVHDLTVEKQSENCNERIHLNNIYINELCDSTFDTNSTLKKHDNRCKRKKIVCDLCQKEFSYRNHFNAHIFSHTGERPFVCNVCQKGFSRKTVLKDHMRIHSGEKPFPCNICGKPFAQKNHLMRHLMTHTGERRFVCDLCQKRFSDRSHLDRHILTHTGEKPYSCDICLKRFSQSSGLSSHLRTHTGEKIEKIFTCDICHKDFAYRNLLNIHIRSHTGEKFFCGVCRKGFSQKSDLTVHFRTHTGEKPFPCLVCEKRFARRSHLNTHTRVHTGEKPEKRYACDVCQKKFSQRCMMRKHRLIHDRKSFISDV